MFKIDKHHLIIAGKTILLQILLFFSLLFVFWGSQKLYALIDRVDFPEARQVAISTDMSENDKGRELIDALTGRLRYEMGSTFGWSANDVLFNKFIFDNRAYRQFGTYKATKALLDNYSTTIAKLGPNDRENQSLYDARMNYFALAPSRWGILFIPSAESSYRKGLELVDQYKAELDTGTSVYNIRNDDVYAALDLIVGENILGHALGLLSNSQELGFWQLDNRIHEAQGMVLVVRDYMKALWELYPDILLRNNAANYDEAMRYMDLIATYDPLYITSWFNCGELIISYLMFTKNRLEDIRDSIRI